MSSVVALIDWGRWGGPAERQHALAVERMLLAAPHRAVDGTWRANLGPAVLGIGLRATTVRQRGCRSPIFIDSVARLGVVCDARLDNLDQLHGGLGLDAGTSSDAELIARAYTRWDLDVAARLRGDFSFVVFDGSRQRVIAARDPFGVRNLHYRAQGSVFAVATEVAQLLEDSPSHDEIDPLAILDHLTGHYAYQRPTFFRSITRVEPGHVLVATVDRQTQMRYWHPPQTSLPPAPVAEYASEFGRLFRRSVRARLTSPSPTATQLSGGLDSSSIVCLAVGELSATPALTPALTALAATFPGLDCDESTYIEMVRAKTGVPLETWSGISDGASDDELMVVDRATPFGRILGIGNGPPTDLELARARGARVLLTGEGGNQVTEETNFAETLVGQGRWGPLCEHLFGPRDGGEPLRARLQRGLSMLRRHRIGVPVPWRDVFDDYYDRQEWDRRSVPDWAGPRLRSIWPGPYPDSVPQRWSSRRQEAIWSQVNDARCTWNNDYYDQIAARHGVEVRYPFLDFDLVTFMLSLPESVVAEAGGPRGIHKAAMAEIVPKPILERRWGVAFDRARIRNVHRALPVIRDTITSSRWVSGDYVRRSAAIGLLNRLAGAEGDHGSWRSWDLLRNIAALEIWLRAI